MELKVQEINQSGQNNIPSSLSKNAQVAALEAKISSIQATLQSLEKIMHQQTG